MLKFHLFLVKLIQLFPVFLQGFLITVVFIVAKKFFKVTFVQVTRMWLLLWWVTIALVFLLGTLIKSM